MKKYISILIVFCMFITLSDFTLPAAETGPGNPVAAGKENIPLEDAGGPGKISLDLKGMDVVEVIKMLATRGSLNVVLGDGVRGRVTIFLKSVNLMDAFEIILLANNLAYDKQGDIMYIMTQRDYEAMYGEKYADKKEARIFQLKFAKAAEVAKTLNQMKAKMGRIVVDEGSNTVIVIDSPPFIANMANAIEKIDVPTTTKVFELSYAKAADMKAKITETLTKGVGTVQVDERTNKIIVTDLTRKMAEIEEMVTAFDDKLQQVLIEAKIVQITLNDKYKLGIDWQSVITKLNRELSIKNTFELATAAAGMNPGLQVMVGALDQGSDFAMMVQALKEVGDTNLLSSPRITALNNQEAKILIGTSEPYATNTVTQGTSTSTTATNLSFIDVGVKLYVTPTINKDGFVSMKIKPEVSSKSGTYPYGAVPQTEVPIVATTQAETSVTVKDGTTIIIAGLIKDERSSTVNKVPVLGDIPMFGVLFQKTSREIKKQELVIFLTPHIITGEVDYIKSPMTPPMGDDGFTVSEKPGFERRDDYEIDPTIFKKDKTYAGPGELELLLGGKGAEKAVSPATTAEYYYSVKQKIIENIMVPKARKRSPDKGSVRIAFFLSQKGDIAYGPEILKSSNHALNDMAVKAVKRAAPFPAFPGSMGQNEKRFIIDLDFQ